MSLSDIMGHLDLSIYPQVALVIFVAVFAAVVRRAASGWSREEELCGRLPLDEGPAFKAAPRPDTGSPRGRVAGGRR